jgi:hypothetical protein
VHHEVTVFDADLAAGGVDVNLHGGSGFGVVVRVEA